MGIVARSQPSPGTLRYGSGSARRLKWSARFVLIEEPKSDIKVSGSHDQLSDFEY